MNSSITSDDVRMTSEFTRKDYIDLYAIPDPKRSVYRSCLTRIPIFGSRIPVPGQFGEDSRPISPIEPKQFSELSRKDLGKKVRVADKEGTLRFIGNVHFSQGVWCGIELPNANGKNDGCVRGVRYFACPDSRGLMAPLCKVSLVDGNEFDDGENIHSGPHSMLFGIKDGFVGKDLDRIDVNTTFVSSNDNCEGETSNLQKNLIRSDTYDSIPLPEKNQANRTLVKSATYDKSEEDYNTTFDICTKECEVSASGDETLSYLNENNFPDIVNSTRITPKFDNSNDASGNFEDLNETVTLNNSAILVTNKDKRRVPNSLTCLPCTSTNLNSTVIYSESKPKKSTYTFLDGDKKSTPSSSQRVKASYKHETQTNDPSNNLNDTYVGEPKLKCLKLHGIESQNLYTESDIENCIRRRRVKGTPTYSPATEDDSTKRNSLEFEESLGILTPEQMADFSGFPECRTLSSENIGALPNDFQNFLPKFQSETKPQEVTSPNLPDVSIKDLSLGIIDENMLLSFAMKSEAANLDLPLDSVSKSKSYAMARLEQTPSPEDLPLDPTPVIECESKVEPTKSKTTNSFITSITSITSLDTGYQGDGEMSRPASRGADHSPLTRRPMPRPQPRRPDPLTDSDFYTESDADNHEEHPLRGDRLARIIDGTLYGVDPQAAADIYVNNRENMDSSGIFTDIEGNTRTDELSSAENENVDVSPSPSDTSSKTISNDSQNNAPVPLNKTVLKTVSNSKHNNSIGSKEKGSEIQLKGKSPTLSSAASSPASARSPRHTPKDDSASKKYKMPKRNVASKVKAVLESSTQQRKETITNTPPKKTVGRWDAVMNKITKNPSSFKEIKSKVFTNNNNSVTVARPNVTPNNKQRRTRARSDTTITKINNGESLHSSASDLSGASPAKRFGSTKKRAEVVRVTQVLTAAKLSPRSVHQNTLAENKKNVTKLPNDVKTPPRKILFTPKDKKPILSTGYGFYKGGRASPGARPPQQTRVPLLPICRTTEALAVLVQHLVFNLEAFQTPSLKNQIEKSRMIAEEAARFSCRQMEDHINEIEAERLQYRKDIDEIVEQHRKDIMQLKRQHLETEQELIAEHENIKRQLSSCHNEQLLKLRVECSKLQKSHGQSLDILREENDSIREELMINKAVLELKQNEIADLRKLLAQANQKAELVPRIADKVSVLSARCEDLESQLESKSVYEHQLLSENRKLQESLKEEMNQSIRLRQHNEELQWKVQQNKEVVSRVIEETSFSRCLHNSYDRDCMDLSPPSSPKVKGVVEKSDSVSYVLEIEESPQIIASRIVRRSFRNSTPPKTSTPGSTKFMERTSKSSISDVSSINLTIVWDLEDFNDDDIQLPALPSGIGQKTVTEVLPVPKI
ncbi:hypothetical protein RI129_006523 [Pyrocoelia pectoralis]|uniref:CAP-Gly domain-containing protein n=1 Tax=Pyrocoelia pectoralis TaxID=417401 RepID=A0AAN7VEA8_9COLE